MSDLKITGVLTAIFDTQQVSERFSKREFVLGTGGDYPQSILFQLTGNRIDLIDSYTEGQEIEVSFNLRGREWFNPSKGVNQYFNTLDAWKIQPAGQAQAPRQSTPAPAVRTAPAPPPPPPVPKKMPVPADVMGSNTIDDLPF